MEHQIHCDVVCPNLFDTEYRITQQLKDTLLKKYLS